jgi:TolB protein
VNVQKSIAIGVGVFIGCQMSTGCASQSTSSPTTTFTSTPAAAPTIQPLPTAPTSSAATTTDPVAFAEPEPTVTFAPAPPNAYPPTRLISIFGELDEASAHSGSPFDGGSNLAQITFATEGACVDPDIDRSGTWIAFASTMHRSTSDIYIKSVSGKTQTQITTDPADDVMPVFGPDGKTLCFASNRAGNWDIYTTSIDGGTTVQLTNDADHELHPSWSSDGRMVAYCKFGSQSQRWEIWTVDALNPGVRNFLEYGVFPQWCPDPARNKMLFQRAKQRGSRDYSVWTIDVVNGQAKHPTEIVSAANAALINPSWSPDGSRIVFVTVVDPEFAPADRPVQSDLWIVNLDGSERTMLTNGQFSNFQPVWATTNVVYFVSDRSGTDNVWSTTIGRSTAPTPTHTAGVTGDQTSAPSAHP